MSKFYRKKLANSEKVRYYKVFGGVPKILVC